MIQPQPTTFPSSAFFMWRLFLYRPWPQVLSGLCWVFFHSWPLFPGLLAKAFFDRLEGRPGARLTVESIVILVVVLAVVRIGFVYLDLVVGGVNGFRLRGLLQRNLLMRILERPGAKALPGTVGDAISTIRDDVETMYGAGWAFDGIGFAIFAFGGLAILLSVDVWITLIVFVPIVLVIVLAHVARTRLVGLREQSRQATAQVTGAIGEIFAAVQAIQVAGAEDKVIDHLRHLGEQRQQAMLRDRLLQLALGAIFENTANLGAGLTLLVAGSAMRSGEFTIGDFVLFSTYLMQVAGMTGFLGYLVTTYQQMGVAFKRAVALLQGAPPVSLVAEHPVYVVEPIPHSLGEQANPPLAVAPLERLTVKGLTLRYPDTGGGIEDVAFCLERGSFTVITGRISAGKTTLVRALLGLLDPQQGEILWNDLPIETAAGFFTPPRVAYTPQVPTLLSGTVRDNILLGLAGADQQIHWALHQAVMERDLADFPNGLDTLIGTRGMKLSGGQIQRTAAARMFVRTPELLVFDDLSSALDVETEQALWARLAERKSAASGVNVTCLVVSHRPAALRRADKILVLKEGRVVDEGGLEELLERCEEMRQIWSNGDRTMG